MESQTYWVEFLVYSKRMPEEGPLKRCCPPEMARIQVTEGNGVMAARMGDREVI